MISGRIVLAGERVRLRAERALLWNGTVILADPLWAVEELVRLDALLRGGARRMIVLGGGPARAPDSLARWRARHARVEILQVGLDIVEEPPFAFRSAPAASEGYLLAGGAHPAIDVPGRARRSLRLPCFCFGPTFGVLPAFGGPAAKSAIQPAPGDRVYAIAGSEILACD